MRTSITRVPSHIFYLEDATPTPPPVPVDGETPGVTDETAPPADGEATPPLDGEVAGDGEGSGEGSGEGEDADIEGATDEELEALETTLSEEFRALYDAGNPDATATARMAEIADDIDQLRAEVTRRQTERAEQQRIADELKSRITAAPSVIEEQPAPVAEVPGAPAEEILEPIAASASAPRQTRPRRNSLAASLSQARVHAPPVTIETTSQRGSTLVITAAAEVAGLVERGGNMSDLELLASATIERARVLGDSPVRVQVAQIRREFEHKIDRTMSASQVMEVMRAAANPDNLLDENGALVASGGWCAPNIPLFTFFNIAAEDGLLDLPTVGIDRAGIQWPVSPSIADFLGTDSVWNWTETDDQAAATGSPTKPCVHVPCPDLDDARLEADGICVTAGFLQEAAWPELVENHLSLTVTAHVHTLNRSHILQIAALSTGVTMVEDGVGAIAPILAAVDLQAIDYREKYAMDEDAILEVVFPRWVRGAMRSDAAYRPGVENMVELTDADINDMFVARKVKVQFISDWQTRGSGIPGGATALTSFPNSVQFMMYAAGTFVRGNGPKIDIGVIRDSTLNALNDYTAAWSEEATLIAMIGHESRLVTVDICGHGQVGIGTAIACV